MAAFHIFVSLLLLTLEYIEGQTATECPDGFTAHGFDCYLFVNQPLSWFEAQIACWSMGSRLAEVESEEENHFLGNLIRSQNADYAWLGMTDFAEEGVFMLTSQHLRVGYTNWRQGEPNDALHGEDCVFMAPDSQWLDAECHVYRKPFICEIPNGELTGPSLVGKK